MARRYIKRLREEFANVQMSYNVHLVEDDISVWKVELDVEGFGIVNIHINFPKNYPFSPPRVNIPRIYHPNIYKSGDVCLSILHEAKLTIGDTEGMDEKWSPGIGMESLLASLVSVLHTPNLDSPANVDAKILYSSNYSAYLERNQDHAVMRANERLKEEQDKAYQEASKKDQSVAEGKKKLKKQEYEVETAKEAASIKAAVEQSEAASTLPPEPAADCGKVLANIRFRTPTSTLARRFLGSHTLSVLMHYLRSEGFRPEDYKVLANWPRRDLSKFDPSATLEFMKLCPQETLTLEARDHCD